MTTNWLVSCIFYDSYDRPLQTRSNNHLNYTAQDINTVLYDYAGHVTKVKTTHAGSTTVSTTLRYTYNNSWRTTGVYETINTGTEQQVAAYEYNVLGQLVDKKLHNTGGSSFMQSLDYRYNIRGCCLDSWRVNRELVYSLGE